MSNIFLWSNTQQKALKTSKIALIGLMRSKGFVNLWALKWEAFI